MSCHWGLRRSGLPPFSPSGAEETEFLLFVSCLICFSCNTSLERSKGTMEGWVGARGLQLKSGLQVVL